MDCVKLGDDSLRTFGKQEEAAISGSDNELLGPGVQTLGGGGSKCDVGVGASSTSTNGMDGCIDP
jgi:hypothetical protein